MALIVAFDKQYGMSLSVERLYLGGNSFDKEGTTAFETWLSHVKSHAKLTVSHSNS